MSITDYMHNAAAKVEQKIIEVNEAIYEAEAAGLKVTVSQDEEQHLFPYIKQSKVITVLVADIVYSFKTPKE